MLQTIKGSTNLVQMHHLHPYSPSNTNEDEKFRSWTEEVLLVFFSVAGCVSFHQVSVVISTSRSTREEVCLCSLGQVIYQAFIKTNPESCYFYPLNSKGPKKVNIKVGNNRRFDPEVQACLSLLYKMEDSTSPNYDISI